jgi:hypothetical protein
MFFQSEDSALVKTDPLEDAIPVQQAVVKYGNLRFRLWVEVSVDVNFKIHTFGRVGLFN